MATDGIEVFREQLDEWGLRLKDPAVETLLRYARRLSSYREANVVGTKDLRRLLLEHVLDSLSCLLYEPLRGVRRVVDVGSGGGLPGVPLKIARPETEVTLVEATGKKARFLQQAAEDLLLDGVEVANARAEGLGQDPAHRERYDAATARALAPLPTLAEYCLPLVREGGCVVAMKAMPEEKEVEEGRKAAARLGAEISRLVKVEFLQQLPEKQRCLAIMTKTSETPQEYPRRPGIPKKRPLGS